jgi:hypothetical protein
VYAPARSGFLLKRNRLAIFAKKKSFSAYSLKRNRPSSIKAPTKKAPFQKNKK